jgi:hypothetical protein
MKGPSGDLRHLVRMAGLFVAGIVTFLMVRVAMVPAGFGEFGHYRAGALADNRNQPLRYAGRQACADCHDDVVEVRARGAHAAFGCEACHGPLAAHVADPTASKAERPHARDLCLRCHAANPARPKSFPQIVASDHAPDGACSECHQPHAPGLD